MAFYFSVSAFIFTKNEILCLGVGSIKNLKKKNELRKKML